MVILPQITAENARERTRLRGLIERLSDADWDRSVGSDWTLTTVLVHLAFWDQCALARLERWEQLGVAPALVDVEVVNAALGALARSIPPRVAADLALTGAEGVDAKVARLAPVFAQAVAAAGQERTLRRALHRGEHLDRVEEALRR